jgi:hypothetical protein
MIICVDQTRGARDGDPSLIVAVKVADGDDPVRWSARRCGRDKSQERRKREERDSDHPPEAGTFSPHRFRFSHCSSEAAMALMLVGSPFKG